MFLFIKKRKAQSSFKFIVTAIIVCFFAALLAGYLNKEKPQPSDFMPAPDKIIPLSQEFFPPLIKGLVIDASNPFHFDFIIETGDKNFDEKIFKQDSRKLIKYFLTTLTIPEEDLWVNLSPYEKDKITPNNLGATELGENLLSQDYILKQIFSSLLYPESSLGKKFWDRVYEKAYQTYGTVNIPINTFNKVWVVPDKAVIYEKDNTAYVAESRLRVMLEEDYLALKNNINEKSLDAGELNETDIEGINNLSSTVMKEIILPEIEKEVNSGKNFSPLRQAYNSLILAVWFKEKLKQNINKALSEGSADILTEIYLDKSKIEGVSAGDKELKEKIYQKYLEAYKKGVFNYIKTDYDLNTAKNIRRHYYSGGADFTDASLSLEVTSNPVAVSSAVIHGDTYKVGIALEPDVAQASIPDFLDKLIKINNQRYQDGLFPVIDSKNIGLLHGVDSEQSITVEVDYDISGKTTDRRLTLEAQELLILMEKPGVRSIRIAKVVPQNSKVDFMLIAEKLKDKDNMTTGKEIVKSIRKYSDEDVFSAVVVFSSGMAASFYGNKEMLFEISRQTEVKEVYLGEGVSWLKGLHEVSYQEKQQSHDAIAVLISRINPGASMSSLNTDVAGMEVFHGTLDVFEADVRAGPKDKFGSGFGGPGIYLAVTGEKKLAEFFAGWAEDEAVHRLAKARNAADNSLDKNAAKGIVLRGRVNPGKNLKVGRFEIIRDGEPDLEKGVLPADWAKDPMLLAALTREFDILDIRNMKDNGLSMGPGSNRVLVVHERAGKNAILWEGPEPLNESYSFPLGAQVANVDGRYITNLKRILNVMRQSSNVPGISQDATDAEIIEFTIEYLQTLDEQRKNKTIQEPILTESTDSYGNRIIRIDELAIPESQNKQIGRLIEAVLRRAVDPEEGVKAINFQGSDSTWTIVGFKQELEDKKTLSHEQREVALRKLGLDWKDAHRLVETNQDKTLAVMQKALDKQTQEATSYELGAQTRLGDDLFELDALRVWQMWNNSGEDTLLKEIYGLREKGYIISIGDWPAMVDAMERSILPVVKGKTKKRVVEAIGLLGENVNMHAGGEGILIVKLDEQSSRMHIVVMDKGEGFKLDGDGLPDIIDKTSGRFKKGEQSPGKGVGLGRVLGNVDELYIYTKGYIFNAKEARFSRNEATQLLQGTLFSAVIDYKNNDSDDTRLSSAAAAGVKAGDQPFKGNQNPGGIDLNPVNLDMEVGGGNINIPEFIPSFDIETFNGFTFSILKIEPIKDLKGIFGPLSSNVPLEAKGISPDNTL
ncbi:MAG: hypothetical protein PHU64_05990 [Candidatus Omnitrophica bacterium]|nr:hypothetical protein [Candidatus Omnitrophota bacterium]